MATQPVRLQMRVTPRWWPPARSTRAWPSGGPVLRDHPPPAACGLRVTSVGTRVPLYELRHATTSGHRSRSRRQTWALTRNTARICQPSPGPVLRQAQPGRVRDADLTFTGVPADPDQRRARPTFRRPQTSHGRSFVHFDRSFHRSFIRYRRMNERPVESCHERYDICHVCFPRMRPADLAPPCKARFVAGGAVVTAMTLSTTPTTAVFRARRARGGGET